MSARDPRLHLVSPATVERTVAWLGMARVLSDAERRVFERMASDRRRRDWLAGRIAAKRAVRAAARERAERVPPYGTITVWNEASGAPGFTVVGRPELAERWNISISHADGTALAALACTDQSGTVGVDLERTRPLADALIRRVLTAREVRAFDVPSPDRPAPLVVWTIKEAVLKAGRGTWPALRHIELTWSGTRPLSVRILGPTSGGVDVAVTHGTVGAYTIALALWRAAGSLSQEVAGTTGSSHASPSFVAVGAR